MELKNLYASSSISPFCLLLLSLFSFSFFFTSLSASSSPIYLSGSLFVDEASIGRNLLQVKKACPVNFEFLNYTIITSQCKGPKYAPKFCCKALTDFACPYADDLNDLSNDCATTMFSYINLYGQYPPGLFSSTCKGDKEGLICSDSESYSSSAIRTVKDPKALLVLTIALLGFLFLF